MTLKSLGAVQICWLVWHIRAARAHVGGLNTEVRKGPRRAALLSDPFNNNQSISYVGPASEKEK